MIEARSPTWWLLPVLLLGCLRASAEAQVRPAPEPPKPQPLVEAIVYTTLPPPNLDLYLFEEPGGDARRLTDDPAKDYNTGPEILGMSSTSLPGTHSLAFESSCFAAHGPHLITAGVDVRVWIAGPEELGELRERGTLQPQFLGSCSPPTFVDARWSAVGRRVL
ncbi:MAG TPA: hypothetical protein VMT85_22850 [Thermoanaerobaculia bacterium]|nr:hypothetical protein [Thermoanaerobaculia bacterium]